MGKLNIDNIVIGSIFIETRVHLFKMCDIVLGFIKPEVIDNIERNDITQ
jgi:hypothetical protein